MRLSLASDAKQFWQGRPLCVTTGCRSADCPATNCKGNEVKAVILLSLTSPLPSNAKRTAVTNYQTVRLSLSILAVGTSSFLTRSVQLIFSFLLQHHTSKLSTYFLSTFRGVQVPAQNVALLCTEIICEYCRNHVKHINTVCEGNSDSLTLEQVVYTVTTVFSRASDVPRFKFFLLPT